LNAPENLQGYRTSQYRVIVLTRNSDSFVAAFLDLGICGQKESQAQGTFPEHFKAMGQSHLEYRVNKARQKKYM
jgi:hypothetical protein